MTTKLLNSVGPIPDRMNNDVKFKHQSSKKFDDTDRVAF